jgi:hypothetical protein
MYSTTQSHAPTQSNFPASNENSAPIRNKAHIATLHQSAFVGSDPSTDSSASGHSISPDIDFNVQLTDDTTAYSADFLHLSPPSQGPSSYWGRSDSDSQGSSSLSVPDSEIDIKEQLFINTPDSLYNVYMAKVLPVTISDQQRWRLLCPDCKQWVQTSMSSQLPLWHPGQFSSLSSHRGGKKCIKASITYNKPVLDRTASRSLSLTSDRM